MEDARYAEMRFLEKVNESLDPFPVNTGIEDLCAELELSRSIYPSFIRVLLQEDYVTTTDHILKEAVENLRHENLPGRLVDHPRDKAENQISQSTRTVSVTITYRGLRRISELQEHLIRDRILEPFGILLDARYVQPDLIRILLTGEDIAIICLDMDKFKPINDNYGHDAGDEVIKAYLQTVKDVVAHQGKAYRSGGDEVVVILRGVCEKDAEDLANRMRKKIKSIEVDYNGELLSGVSASIGVACSPPLPRNRDLKILADSNQRQAKKKGGARVIVG